MNICIISSAFPSRRNPVINIFIYRQAKALAERGHKVFVVAGDTESRKEGNMIVYARPNAIKSALLALKAAIKIPKDSLWLLKNIGLKGTIGRLALVELAYKILKEEKIDVIDGHWADYGAVVAYLLSRILKRKYIATCHGSDVACDKEGLPSILTGGRREIVSTALENASNIIVESKSIAEDVKKYCSKNPLIVHYGIDLNLFKPISKKLFKKRTVISVGALTKRKGYDYLLEAIKKVLEKDKNINFLIIGDGPEKTKLKNLARKLGIADNITFKDLIKNEDLPIFYSSSEFFALATLHEGFGNVFIEAMACGIPVVSTNVAAVPEAVGEGGILVEPRNPDQLAEAMLKLLNDENLRQELSKKALEHAKKFSIENRINKIEEIYRKVVQNENLLHIQKR